MNHSVVSGLNNQIPSHYQSNTLLPWRSGDDSHIPAALRFIPNKKKIDYHKLKNKPISTAANSSGVDMRLNKRKKFSGLFDKARTLELRMVLDLPTYYNMCSNLDAIPVTFECKCPTKDIPLFKKCNGQSTRLGEFNIVSFEFGVSTSIKLNTTTANTTDDDINNSNWINIPRRKLLETNGFNLNKLDLATDFEYNSRTGSFVLSTTLANLLKMDNNLEDYFSDKTFMNQVTIGNYFQSKNVYYATIGIANNQSSHSGSAQQITADCVFAFEIVGSFVHRVEDADYLENLLHNPKVVQCYKKKDRDLNISKWDSPPPPYAPPCYTLIDP
ncbi:unnamed protein product [Ambrosiozyma monospora]|uniref:Unnamed protein product n=1 Tax=Ambrosiozyma monospora TaxID=43982 RepID=A0A9W7DHK8_AMBMO|nr:unnamed protein product [Ambrosiozyma monospora]